jgi:hypothetical protein
MYHELRKRGTSHELPAHVTYCTRQILMTNEVMGAATSRKTGNRLSGSLAIAAALAALALPCARALAAQDLLQEAINYVFTGKIDPIDAPEIVDRKSCVVVVPEPKFKRYARYYLSRFKMDTSRIGKKYAGSQPLYELEVEGDDVIFEYLKPDKTTVDYGFRSAHISLPGDIGQTEKALALIFSQYCKPEPPKGPF